MIGFHTDHYFHIGAAHLTSGKPCQDYAISGERGGLALAIVSDGCSTGRHTDNGARVTVLSAAKAIREHWIARGDIFKETTARDINLHQKIISTGAGEALGLCSPDMLATCVYAIVASGGGLIHVRGDGVVVSKYSDGRLVMSRYEWSDNIPYYPSYSGDDLLEFIKAHGGDLNAPRLSEEKWHTKSGGEFEQIGRKEYSLSEGIEGIAIKISEDELKKDLDFVAVFSDGVAQISQVDWKEAVVSFMSFKNMAGVFATRRMISGIKEYQKVGKGPLDDIAYSVIRIIRDNPNAQNE